MLDNNASFRYERLHNCLFVIMQCWTNGTVKSQFCAIKIGCNMYHINQYTYDTNIKDIKF